MNKLVVDLLEFSRDLYVMSVQEETELGEHKGVLRVVEIEGIQSLEKYFEKVE